MGTPEINSQIDILNDISMEFVVSGTLGDMFIIFCKLYDLRKKLFKKKIRLIYYTTHPQFYPLLQRLFSYIDVIIDKPILCSSAEDNNQRIINCAAERNIPYISVVYDGSDDGIGLSDPDYISLEAYPEIDIRPKELDGHKLNIGIQLHSGKLGGNFKGFSLSWLRKIRNWLAEDECDIYLFGKGNGYSTSKIQQFCEHYKIKNRVGQTDFEEWLSYIKALNFFITPEGFSAFFAMSQKVRSLVFFTDYQILRRVLPEWRKENIIMSAGQREISGRLLNYVYRKIIKRNRLLAPLKPEQVWSLIYSEQAYK